MNQLTGKYVNVVLAVEEGKGMDFITNPLSISANFNGRILDSDMAVPEDCPAFNTEMVWEIEKKDLRKIRSSNQPLRLECQCIDSANRKERIGFVLLSLRSAQIIPLPAKNSKVDEVKFKWHRLLGVQNEKKNCRPELYLSLAIKDHLLNQSSEVIDSMMPFITEITEEEPIVTSEESADNFMTPGSIGLQYLDDGFIRIGNERNATEAFYLNILTKSAANMDLLLSENLVFNQVKEKYYISFKLFGIVIKTRPFFREPHEQIDLNEKIVVKLLSNLPTLKEYFEAQKIDVAFLYGNSKLGSATIELNKLLHDDSDENFCNIFTSSGQCYFTVVDGAGDMPKSIDRKPYIDIETSLSKMRDLKNDLSVEDVTDKRSIVKTVVSNIERNLENASGDQETNIKKDVKLGKLSKVEKKAQSEHDITAEPKVENITRSLDTMVKTVAPQTPQQDKLAPPTDFYETYCLEVTLDHIFWKKYSKETKINFKFLHPKSANCFAILKELDNALGEDISVNVKFKVLYVTKGGIQGLMQAWPPKIVLTDEKEKLITDECEISPRGFFESNLVTFKHSAELKAVRTLESIGKLKLNMTLQKLDYSLTRCIDLTDVLMPPVLDEMLIIEEINDLQTWIDNEKEKALKQLRLQELEQKESWQEECAKRKEELEEKLNRQIKKGKSIQSELKKLLNRLKTHKALKGRSKKSCSSGKITELKYLKYSQKELVDMVIRREEENERLHDLIAEERQKYEAFQKSALTKEQTANLLQELRGLEEKFSEAQNAKQYFKEQWRKACDEIHELKAEDYKQLQNQLQQEREELSQLSLDQFINKVVECADDFEDLYAREGLETTRSLTGN